MNSNQDTGAVAESQTFDAVALQNDLRPQLAAFDGQLTIGQVKGGQSIRPTSCSRSTVVMCCAPSRARLLASAHAVECEYAVMQALQGSACRCRACCCCARTKPSSAVPFT